MRLWLNHTLENYSLKKTLDHYFQLGKRNKIIRKLRREGWWKVTLFTCTVDSRQCSLILLINTLISEKKPKPKHKTNGNSLQTLNHILPLLPPISSISSYKDSHLNWMSEVSDSETFQWLSPRYSLPTFSSLSDRLLLFIVRKVGGSSAWLIGLYICSFLKLVNRWSGQK